MNAIERYNDYLRIDWERKRAERNQDCFSCSELGQCVRKAFFRRSGLAVTPDAGKLRRMRQGTLIHLDYEAACFNDGRWLVEENVSHGLPDGWEGTTDTVFLAEGGKITDYKTVNEKAFRYSATFPKPADCLQLGGYWLGFERSQKREIAEGSVIYIPMGVYDPPQEYEVDPSWKDEALRRMAAFDFEWRQYLDTGVLPDPPQPEQKKQGWQQNWECSPAYCDHRAQGLCEGGPAQP